MNKVIFLCIGFFLALSAHAQCADDNSFALFFKDFQVAVKTDNPEKVARLVKFPFKARSVLNDEKPMLVSRRQFIQYYKYLMKLEVWDRSGKIVISNLKDHIISFSPEADSQIKEYCHQYQGVAVIHPGTQIGVGALRFERYKNEKWQLSGGLLGDLYFHIKEQTEPVE